MDNKEYQKIIKKIIKNRKFQKLRGERHHYTNDRYNHCLDVSYKTFKLCKILNLDYVSATKAALLHDFFLNEEWNNDNKFNRLMTHSEHSLKNASKIEKLNDKEKDIISSHMFPVGGSIPHYKESVVVDLVDDVVSIKERFKGDYKRIVSICNFLLLIFINIKLK